jgi:uncharacterized protein YciI
VKYAVVLYTSADDMMTTAPVHFPAHRARIDEFQARDEIIMIGTFGDPRTQGAMGIFTSREAAAAFVEGDPFVLNGVVSAYEIRDFLPVGPGDNVGRMAGG